MTGDNCSVFRFSDVEVHERELRLKRAGELLPVEPKAFRVLVHLLRNPGRLIPKDELLNAGWGNTAVTDNSLTRNIALLRRLLDDDTHAPRYIETVSTVGYRFICPVEAIEDSTVKPEAAVAAGNNGQGSIMTVSPTVVPVIPAKKELHWRRWFWPTVTALGVAALAVGYWYLRQPLPPPRITEYSPITHDGHVGDVAGTDGSRIFFDSDPWGSVLEVGVSGGEIAKIPVGSFPARVLDVSSDGANLLLRSLKPQALWTVGTLGGPPRFITEPRNDWSFGGYSWSPDGQFLAFSEKSSVNALSNLDVMRSDGTGVHKLATVKGVISEISWSPDGSRIRFTNESALWEISAAGSNLHPLFPAWRGPAGQCCGRWTPDGKFFVFLAGGNGDLLPILGGLQEIWVLDERHGLFGRAASEPTQLTSGPTRWKTPVPGRDGAKIFARGTTLRGELDRFNSKSNQMEPYLGGISADFLSFSRDGRQIAYVTYPQGVLWRAKPDGSDRVQLTSPPLYPLVCRWSPDGTRILFLVRQGPSNFGLYLVSAQGGNPVPVMPAEKGGQWDGDWSPDGRKIVYAVWPGTSLRIFDLNSRTSTEIPGSSGLYAPLWSPDGRYVAAMTEAPLKLTLFDLKTQKWSTLVESTSFLCFPAWSRDSRFLYYARNGEGFYRVSVLDRKEVRVADLTGFHSTGAFDFWMGLDQNDTPLALRDTGTTDIYALTLNTR